MGYGIKIFVPRPLHYVTRSPGGASDGEVSMSLSSDDNATCNSDDSSNGEEPK